MASPVAPFPLHQQYVSNVLDSEDQGQKAVGGEKNTTAGPAKVSKPDGSGATHPKPSETPDVDPKTSVWNYGSKRKAFIAGEREEGIEFVTAVNLWDDSLEKAQLLGGVSVPELKRRKFLKAGALENPWLKKLEGRK